MNLKNSNILIDKEIIELVNNISIISPFDNTLLSGCSYDIRVGSVLTSRNRTTKVELDNNSYVVELGECITIESLEEFNFRDRPLFGIIANKHSILGKGLFHPITTVDPGFKGKLAITFIHIGHVPFLIKKGDKMCSLYIHQLSEMPDRIYGINLNPSTKEGSTDFSLIINQPEEQKLSDNLKFKYGKPFSDLLKRIENIERKIEGLDGQTELTYFKKSEEKKKDRTTLIRWIIMFVLALSSLIIGNLLKPFSCKENDSLIRKEKTIMADTSKKNSIKVP